MMNESNMELDLISRQAAIDALNGLCDRECEYSKEQRYVMCDACHLGSAFDVIEQLPTQTNTLKALDCVERQKAIDDLHGKDPSQVWDTADVEVWVNALPSAQPDGVDLFPDVSEEYRQGYRDGLHDKPERKKGKWINVRHDNIAECDQCGITGRAWMNFCFDCGADMRAERRTDE